MAESDMEMQKASNKTTPTYLPITYKVQTFIRNSLESLTLGIIVKMFKVCGWYCHFKKPPYVAHSEIFRLRRRDVCLTLVGGCGAVEPGAPCSVRAVAASSRPAQRVRTAPLTATPSVPSECP